MTNDAIKAIPAKCAVAYIRVSSERQVDNVSKDNQRDHIAAKAEREGIEIVEWFIDDGVSAKTADRAGLTDMIAYASRPSAGIDYVMVYSLSRLSRDIGSFFAVIYAGLVAKGINIRSVIEPVDETPMGEFMMTFHLGMAQMDNRLKSKYTRDNMKTLASQGYWQNSPPHGYDSYKLANGLGQLRPTLKKNAAAEKVHNVLERYSEGNISKAELTRYAAAIGLRSRNGKALTESSIDKMLRRPVYAGYVCSTLTDHEMVKGVHPPIISIETFETNQRLLNGSGNIRVGEVHTKANHDYVLRGLLLCANCKNPMYASAPRTGNGGVSPRYHCARSSCRGVTKSVKAEKVHDAFRDFLHRMQPSEAVLKLYREILIRQANKQLDNLNVEIRQRRADLDHIAEQRSHAIERFLEGGLSQEEKDTFMRQLDDRKQIAEVELTKLEAQQRVRESDINEAIDFMRNVSAQWGRVDFVAKQRFQTMLFPRGIVYDSAANRFGTTFMSPLYTCQGIEKDAEASLNSNLVAGAGLEPATSWL